MSFEFEHSHDISRRGFLLGGAMLLGSVALFGSDGLQSINGPADTVSLALAQRLETPVGAPPIFYPWEAGETVYEAPNDQNFVAFRNDDGPWPKSTHQVQQIFSSYGIGDLINPTVIATNVINNPDEAHEYVANGNDLIDHSVTHQYKDAINAAEIQPADDIIEAITGQRPELYAVPGLGEGSLITAEATRLNMPIISTRIFIGDTDSPPEDAATIFAKAKAQIRSGSIIVFHAETGSHEATRTALHMIIEHVQANFVPVKMKTLLYTRYTPDGRRKEGVPIIRKQNYIERRGDLVG